MIRENVLQESRIVGDLLDCSSLASGKRNRGSTAWTCTRSSLSVVRELRREIAEKHIAMKLELGGDSNLVRGDRVRLMQVLRNLLSNSIKFTPDEGKITVRTAATAERVTIEVQDSGMGMTTEVRERLFRPFEQGDRSITRRFGGLGLGLYLAKSIIELHGGTTSASSAAARIRAARSESSCRRGRSANQRPLASAGGGGSNARA